MKRFLLISLAALAVGPVWAQSGPVKSKPANIVFQGSVSFQDILRRDLVTRLVKRERAVENQFEDEEGEKGMSARPIPPGAKVVPAPPRLVDSGRSGRSRYSPAPTRTFEGTGDNGTYIPPDTNGAVGTTHIVNAVNGTVRITNRSGTHVSTVTLDAFFGGSGAFDPRTRYDRLRDRWVLVCTDGAQSVNTVVRIMISKTSDPTGAWWSYQAGAAKTGDWYDYPSVGINDKWVTITTNLYTNASNSFDGASFLFLDRAQVYAGSPVGRVVNLDGEGGTISPATDLDGGSADMYCFNTGWSNATNSYLKKYVISGAIGAETVTPGTFFDMGPKWQSWAGVTNFAPQQGTTNKVANNDNRMQNVVFRGGKAWMTWMEYLPNGSPTRTAVGWCQIDPVADTVVQNGLLGGTGSSYFYAFPSISVNKFGDALIGFSRFSDTQYPSAAYAFRKSTDTAGTMQSDTQFKNGLNTYYKTFGGSSNRWGDYSSTEVDPVDDASFYTVQEYAMSTANQWGTWWAVLEADLPAIPVGTSIPLWRSSDRLLGYWTTSNGAVTGWKSVSKTGAGWDVFGFGDVNSDGKQDFGLFRSSDRSVGWWLWNGSAVSGWQSLSSKLAAGWIPVGCADIDANGKTDLAVLRTSDNTMGFYTLNGGAIVGWKSIARLAAGWVPAGFMDVDGNGTVDVMMRRLSDGSIGGWTMNGNLITGWRSISTKIPAGWTFVGWGDFNNDTKADLLIERTSDRKLGAYLLNGNLVTGWKSMTNVGAGWTPVGGVGDFN